MTGHCWLCTEKNIGAVFNKHWVPILHIKYTFKTHLDICNVDLEVTYYLLYTITSYNVHMKPYKKVSFQSWSDKKKSIFIM